MSFNLEVSKKLLTFVSFLTFNLIKMKNQSPPPPLKHLI